MVTYYLYKLTMKEGPRMVGIVRKATVEFNNSDERKAFDERIRKTSNEFSAKLMNEKIKQSGIRISREGHFNARQA